MLMLVPWDAASAFNFGRSFENLLVKRLNDNIKRGNTPILEKRGPFDEFPSEIMIKIIEALRTPQVETPGSTGAGSRDISVGMDLNAIKNLLTNMELVDEHHANLAKAAAKLRGISL